jgi:hypothetical protein
MNVLAINAMPFSVDWPIEMRRCEALNNNQFGEFFDCSAEKENKGVKNFKINSAKKNPARCRISLNRCG